MVVSMKPCNNMQHQTHPTHPAHLRVSCHDFFMMSIGKVQDLLRNSSVFRETIPQLHKTKIDEVQDVNGMMEDGIWFSSIRGNENLNVDQK